MKSSLFSYGIILLIVFGLLGCQEDEYVAGTTPVTVKITDAPVGYDAVFLHIKEIEIETPSERVTVPVTNGPFNILDYRMGKSLTLVEDFELPSERLREIRIVLHEEGNAVLIDSLEHPLVFPGPERNDWKIDVSDDLKPGVPYNLVLDFDAARSIRHTDEDQYLLTPVIRGFSEAITGAIRGQVIPELAMPSVYLLSNADTLAATLTTQHGEFYFPGIPDGVYQLTVKPAEGIYKNWSQEDISVIDGEIVDLTVELAVREESQLEK